VETGLLLPLLLLPLRLPAVVVVVVVVVVMDLPNQNCLQFRFHPVLHPLLRLLLLQLDSESASLPSLPLAQD
jgi:hypothetical protein